MKAALFLFLILCGTKAFAQNSYRITTHNGLSTNNLTVVIKDRHNFMWMGSFNGLQKHEGSRVKVYKVSSVDSLSLSSNEVHGLFEDKWGYIWAGTMAGLDRINPKTNVVRHYNLKSRYRYTTEEGNGYLYSIFQDKKDSIWVVTDGGLFRIHPETGAYQQIVERNKTGTGVYDSHTGYKGSYITDEGIWMYTHGGMVFYKYSDGKFYNRYYNPQKKEIFELSAGSKIGANGEMCADKNGNLYFIANDSVLIRYNTVTEKIDSFSFTRPLGAWQCCYSLACDFKNNIWIGYRHGGILLFNQSTCTFTPVRFEGINSLIGSNYIYSLTEDYLNKMWVTTNNGIYVIDLYSTNVREIYLSEKREFANLQYNTGMLTEGLNGNLYLPFGDGGLIVYNQHTSKTTHYPTSAVSKDYNAVFPDYKGKSWIEVDNIFHPAFFTNSSLKINFKQELFTYPEEIKRHRIIWVAHIKNTLFVKGEEGAIFSLPDTGKPLRLGGLGFMKQMCFSADSQYLYYLNAQSNLSRHHIATQGEDTLMIAPLLKTKSFSFTDPRDIVDDGNGNIWITSQNGLIRYNITYHSIHIYTVEKGLGSDFSFALCRDRNRNIWVATLGGISRYDAVSDRFHTVHNLSSSTYQDGFGSGLLLRNGLVAFHIGNRLIFINPNRIETPQITPKTLAVTAIEVNGHPVHASTKSFSLRHTQNQLRIRYGLLDFENAARVSYYYNLDPDKEDWKQLGNQSELFFYSLSPGTYRLQIKAVDGSGIPVAGRLERSFEINPPFYKTMWFLGLVLLILLCGGLLFYIKIREKYKTQKLLNALIASLSVQTQIDKMVQDIATNCVQLLGFDLCIVYLLDEEKQVLVLKTPGMITGPEAKAMVLPQEIVIGQGHLGKIAERGIPAISHNRINGMLGNEKTTELAVPIISDNHVYGLIYSSTSRKHIFTGRNTYLLKEVAAVSAARISKYYLEERLRSKIAQDLHDDLGSTLSSIYINSKMALERSMHHDVQAYLKKIEHNSGSMMESMSDIVWAIDPQNDTLEKVLIRMKEFAAEILEPLNISYCFLEEMDTKGTELDLTHRKNFYLIFKESINNAAKYSGCTQVEVQVKKDEGHILLRVKDNGRGFDQARIKKGHGLRNMEERAKDMGAMIEVSSTIGCGTTVQLKVRLT